MSNFCCYEKSDNSTNGLTSSIVDYYKFKGHQAERINTMDTARAKKVIDGQTGKQIGTATKGAIWTLRSGTKGRADLSAESAHCGRSLKIDYSRKYIGQLDFTLFIMVILSILFLFGMVIYTLNKNYYSIPYTLKVNFTQGGG